MYVSVVLKISMIFCVQVMRYYFSWSTLHLKSDTSKKIWGVQNISRKHRELVRAELHRWDLCKKIVEQTYRLASKFL